MKERYLVYFEQVNQEMYDITASSKDEAIDEAAWQWIEDHARPRIAYAERVPLKITEAEQK